MEKQVYSAEWDTGEPFGTNLNKENQRLYSKMSPDRQLCMVKNSILIFCNVKSKYDDKVKKVNFSMCLLNIRHNC